MKVPRNENNYQTPKLEDFNLGRLLNIFCDFLLPSSHTQKRVPWLNLPKSTASEIFPFSSKIFPMGKITNLNLNFLFEWPHPFQNIFSQRISTQT